MLTHQLLPRDPRNHKFTSITSSHMLLLQRGCGFRVGFDSWRAEEDGWLSWRFRRVLRHDVCLVEVYIVAQQDVGQRQEVSDPQSVGWKSKVSSDKQSALYSCLEMLPSTLKSCRSTYSPSDHVI